MLLRAPWKSGSASKESGIFVSATRLTWRRHRDLPIILWQALRLRTTWPRRDGAIGISIAVQPLARTTWSVTVWQDEQYFHRFLASQCHIELMREFRPALSSSSSVTWNAERLRLRQAWKRTRRELTPHSSWLATASTKD